jgi:hypothetical protein
MTQAQPLNIPTAPELTKADDFLRDTISAPARNISEAQMASDNLSIIEICRRELERLRKLAAEYRGVLLPERVQICRDRAEVTRILAERAEDPRAKHLLLEIAEAYDRFPGVSSWDDT